MSKGVSHGSLLELKALTAEHADRFAKDGRGAVRGARSAAAAAAAATRHRKDRDPFARPSPGLVARLAREARADARQRRAAYADEHEVGDAERRAILEAKAARYAALKRGDLSGFSERELAESNLDYAAGAGAWSDHSSDVDESAAVARRRWADGGDSNSSDSGGEAAAFDTLGDMDEIEYVDELGRTRRGTRREAKAAERARARDERTGQAEEDDEPRASVRQSQLIYGDQAFFPVYQPDPEELKKRWAAAEAEARPHHYDSTKEVRVRGAGAYQFALDDETRAQQMADLDAQRQATEAARQGRGGARGTAADARRRRREERRNVVEAKRAQLLGGAERVARLRAERRARETDAFFAELDSEVRAHEA